MATKKRAGSKTGGRKKSGSKQKRLDLGGLVGGLTAGLVGPSKRLGIEMTIVELTRQPDGREVSVPSCRWCCPPFDLQTQSLVTQTLVEVQTKLKRMR